MLTAVHCNSFNCLCTTSQSASLIFHVYIGHLHTSLACGQSLCAYSVPLVYLSIPCEATEAERPTGCPYFCQKCLVHGIDTHTVTIVLYFCSYMAHGHTTDLHCKNHLYKTRIKLRKFKNAVRISNFFCLTLPSGLIILNSTNSRGS